MRGWRKPRYPGEVPTLGYTVLDWISAHLPSPADETQPLVFTDEQAQRTLRWYALDPLSGRFLYRRCECEEAKGWGKSPYAASLALAEFAGPVCFDGWDASGEPVARPWGHGESPPPWVQIAAVSEDQTENTYAALYSMLVANDHRAAIALGIDHGRTRLYLKATPGSRLEPVTASAGSREGQRTTFAILDETHLWTPHNGGVKLARTLRRNAAKMSGRTFETTNAPVLGERSVAEQSGDEPGVLYFANRPSVEPSPDWPPERLRKALDEVYRDARWIDRDRLLAEIADSATPWEDSLRFYFNIRVAGAGRAVDPSRWDRLAKHQDVPAGTPIGIGFDGSIDRDATVLRGCTADGYSFLIGKWLPSPANPVPRAEVHQALAEAFARYRVGRMYCDPPRWYSEIDEWTERYGLDADGKPIVVMLDTNQARRFAPAVDRWLTAIREGTHTHDGDQLTTDHVKSAHLRKVRFAETEDDRTSYVLIKGDENRRIDAAVADVLAHEAALTMSVAPAVAWSFETKREIQFV